MTARALLGGNVPWMAWNSFLAVLPLVLAGVLFRAPDRRPWRSPLWWLGVGAFVALLPNGPYVLTDLIHLPYDASVAFTRTARAALLLQYGLFFAIGFGSYVLAIRRLIRFLGTAGWSRSALTVLVVVVQVLCSVGVYLGRVVRWNSWDLLTQPRAIAADVHAGVQQPFSAVVMLGVFIALTLGTFVALAVVDEIAAHWARQRERYWRSS